MRITNPMVVRNYTRNLHSNRAQLDRFARQISTGRRFDSFSQNNSAGIRAMQVRRNLARIDSNLDNARAAQAYLRSAESMMMNVTENANIINERFILALNDTNGTVDREVVATELERMQEAILALANGQYAGRFVFGGTNTVQRPFEVRQIPAMVPVGGSPSTAIIEPSGGFPAGQFVPDGTDSQGNTLYLDTLSGNHFTAQTRPLIYYNGVRVADIDRTANPELYARVFGDGAHLDVGMNVTFSNEADPTQVDPGSAFRFTLVGLSFMGNGENNMFDTITRMIEFLRAPYSAQNKELGGQLLNQFQETMSVANIAITNLGADTNFLTFTIDRLLDDQLNLRERQQELEIRPPDEAILDFKMQEFIYNATLQMGQRLLQPTLFDFIR